MYAKSVAIAALVALPSVLAGSATVQNNCEADIFVWSVANSADVTMQTLSAGNSTYSEDYRTNPDGGGISIKIAKYDSQSQITQFEYTVGGETIFYDVSNINGYPFEAEGLALTPSLSSCPTVNCPAGTDCTAAYNQPNDVDTKGCSVDADLVMVICPNGSPSSDNSGSSAAPSSTVAAYAATTMATTATPASSSTTKVATTTSVAPAEFAESTSAEASPTAVIQNWHAAVGRRGHSHGHRFARHVQ